jgi:putative nucleotidyltransferase with HDIG domain
VLASSAVAVPLGIANLLAYAVPVAIAALVFYVINTGLVVTVISVSTGTPLIPTWRAEFLWLISHYLVLCVMGLFLSVAYKELGPPGVMVFMLPVLMMRYTQKQYIERTEDSVRELRRMNEELTVANGEIVTANNAILRLNDELFETLARFFDARDPYVGGHAATVATYATAIAVEMGLAGERLKQVRQAALLHDIGKIAIPEKILHKPGKLTDAEYELTKTHATVGAELIEMSEGLSHLAPFIRYHHERWDGRGYPDSRHGIDIPLESRILNVCDSVEAMASDRPYHKGMTVDEVIAELKRCAGTQFDPTVAEVFIRIIEREGKRFVINSAREVSRKQVARTNDLIDPTSVEDLAQGEEAYLHPVIGVS